MVLSVPVLIRAHVGFLAGLLGMLKLRYLLLVCLPQSLQAQIMVGQQHLQALLCQAVHSSEEATEEEK